MVNTQNRIEGRSVAEHPYGDAARLYRWNGQPRLAAKAPIGGVITTWTGDARFQAGDYIVTDVPVTQAWPVQEQTFKGEFVPDLTPEAQTTISEAVKKPVATRTRPRAKGKPKAAKPTSTIQSRKPGVRTAEGVPGKDMADSKSLEALL